MRRVFGVLLVLGAVLGLGYSGYQAAGSAPPQAPEILKLFEDMEPPNEGSNEPVVSGRRLIRGWSVWVENVSKYDRRSEREIHRERDPGDSGRELRVHREPAAYGAKLRATLIVLTGNAP